MQVHLLFKCISAKKYRLKNCKSSLEHRGKKIKYYLAMGLLFLVNSIRRIWKGREHTASTFTTLKSENRTCEIENTIRMFSKVNK